MKKATGRRPRQDDVFPLDSDDGVQFSAHLEDMVPATPGGCTVTYTGGKRYVCIAAPLYACPVTVILAR